MERNLVKRGLTRLMLLPILLSVLYGGVLLWQIDRMLSANDWVRHSIEVLTASSDAQRHIQLEESALRGYLLTRDTIFARQFEREDITIDSLFQQFHAMSLDNPVQSRRLDTLMQLYWSWQISAKRAFSVIQQATFDTNVLARAQQMEIMRTVFSRFNRDEERLFAHRRDDFASGTRWLTVMIVVVSVVLGLVVGLYARRQTQRFTDRFGEATDEAMRSRDLLETTLLSIGDAIIVTGSDQRITLMNRRAEELTGWSIADARARPISDVFRVVEEASRTPIESPIAHALRDRRITEFSSHAVLLSRTGVDYPVEDSAAPIHNSHHDVVGAILAFRDITERREGEHAAEIREREFRALIENTPDLIIRFERDLSIAYVNPAVEAVLGFAPHVLLGRHFKDAGMPEDVYAPWENSVKAVFDAGRGVTTELQYQSIRGIRTYHARLVPQIGERGTEHVVAILRDVTDMKQTSEKLRESEHRFRSIIEQSPDAFFLLRVVRDSKTKAAVDFVLEEMNQHGADFLGVQLDSIGRRLREVLPEEQHVEIIQRYARVIESMRPIEEDHQITLPSSQRRWFHAQAVPINDLLAVTASDVTERIRTDAALRQSEERYRRLVETASEGIFSTDMQGRLTYANPHIRDLAGYSEQEVTQFYFADLVAPSHRSRVKRHFYRQFLSRTPDSQIEAPFLTGDGQERWLTITTTIRMNGDLVEGFDCVATDISERRRLESELAHIEHAVATAVEAAKRA
ncbi:MAG: PAS domain S-box protein [Bacteroidota bacterium]|nr:PAS domain S-box protein [Bacteroidota bacterium]MDP4233823.1 PAS domain S-box protein [Bacteroidota bacterium]MDP4242478.1 PAS domain S-box protein [Bacteroidota bacterium]MDP4289066.1 PAS domain S-box protein [Bacteroidota bacterium]